MKMKSTFLLLLSLAMMVTANSKSSDTSSSSGTSSGSNYPGDLTKGRHLTIYVEGLADPSSGFFRVLNNGAQQAGKDLGVDVKYVYPASVDLASYTEKIEETIAAKPDGILILGIGDLDAVAKEAKGKGIAVAFNPAPSVKDQPLRDSNDVYVSRVGADEYAAGQMAANRFVDKGAKSMICVQEEVGDGTQTERAAGMQQVARAKGVKYDHVAGDPDPGKTASIVEAYLRSHPDVDACHRATCYRRDCRRQGSSRATTANRRLRRQPGHRRDDPEGRFGFHHGPARMVARLHLGARAGALHSVRPNPVELFPDWPADCR
jgi:simple sugar transport system substrate-binding protein